MIKIQIVEIILLCTAVNICSEKKIENIIIMKPGVYSVIKSVTTFPDITPIINDSCDMETTYKISTDSMFYIKECEKKYQNYLKHHSGIRNVQRDYLVGKIEPTSIANRFTCGGYYLLFNLNEESKIELVVYCINEVPENGTTILYLKRA